MRALPFAAACAIISICFLSVAEGADVGVAPREINLGEIESGNDYYNAFSILTQFDKELLVGLGATPVIPEIFDKPEHILFRNESSEEDASTWVFFPANPVVIKPENNSGKGRNWRNVGFTIRIPENAEPCYHAVQLKPSPYSGKIYETGVSMSAIATITLLFKVSGDCIRDGDIIDIQQSESMGRGIEMDTYFKNTGSATMSVKVSEMKIAKEDGTEIAASSSATKVLAPGKMTVLKTYFDPALFEAGKVYKISSNVSYLTGSAAKSVAFAIDYAAGTGKSTATEEPRTEASFPDMTALLLILIIIAGSYAIYRRK